MKPKKKPVKKIIESYHNEFTFEACANLFRAKHCYSCTHKNVFVRYPKCKLHGLSRNGLKILICTNPKKRMDKFDVALALIEEKRLSC